MIFGCKIGVKRAAMIGLTILSQAATFPSFEASLAAFSLFFSRCSRILKICTVDDAVEHVSDISDKKGRIST